MVSDRSESFTCRAVSLRENIPDLVHESESEHLFDPQIDSLVEKSTISIVRSQEEHVEKRVFLDSELELGSARLSPYFESPDDGMVAIGMDGESIARIQSGEHIPDVLVSSLQSESIQGVTIPPVWLSRWYIEMESDSIEIESRTSAKNGHLSSADHILYERKYILLVLADRIFFIGIADREHVMPDSLHLILGHLSGSDIHVSENLTRIGTDDLAIQVFCELDGKPCLATSGRTIDDDNLGKQGRCFEKSIHRIEVYLHF